MWPAGLKMDSTDVVEEFYALDDFSRTWKCR